MDKRKLIFRPEDENTFNLIKTGKKKVEVRAGNKEYLSFQAGDIITFSCLDQQFDRIIKRVTLYPSLDGLLTEYDYKVINPTVKNKQELLESILSFPNYKTRIEQYGILAFELGD